MSKLVSVRLLVLLLGPFSPLGTSAEEAAQPPPRWYDTFEIHGLIDSSFSANLSQQQRDPTPLRVFDALNGFQLSYAELTAQLVPAAVYAPGFRLDLGVGQAAAILNGNASYGLAPSPSSGIGSVAVQQAYLSLKLPHGIELDGGKFVTDAGAEVIEAKDDWLYSRSLLFGFAIPFTHTGLMATLPVPGVAGLSVLAGLFNGFDNPPGPVGSQKLGHLALVYSGPSSTRLVLNAFYGYALPSDADTTLLLDGVAARSFGDLSLNVNVDYRDRGGAKLWGISAMARYSLLGDKLRVSARGEYLDDSDGLGTGAANRYYEGTVGLSVPVGANAEVRLEARHDQLDTGTLASGSSGQTTGQVAALAWF